MPGPTLSVLCMAFDEVEGLRAALASARPIADELLVVSTGGSDVVARVATEFDANLIDHAWDDDFSAPLNAGLDRASCRWVLRLDTDETLLPLPGQELHGLLQREDVLLYSVRREEFHGQDLPPVEMLVHRMWRADLGIRYRGRYHEHFHEQIAHLSDETGLRVADSPMRLVHRGHDRGRRESKLQRGTRIMELELRERPGQLYYEIELGRTWTALGDPRGRSLLEQALTRTLQAEHSPIPPTVVAGPLLEHCLRSWDLSGEERERLERLAHRWFPKSLPLLDLIATRAFTGEEWERAAALFERMVRLAEVREYDASTPFSPRLLGDGPLLHVAVCHHRLANWTSAERCYRKLLDLYPDHPSGVANLKVLLEQKTATVQPAPPRSAKHRPHGRRR